MGQYHRIYNVTKKETFKIGGAKLWEQTSEATAAAFLLLLSNSNGRGGGDFLTYPESYDKPTLQDKENRAVIALVSGRWAGDKIVIQGDYAKKGDPAFFENLDGFTDITRMVCDALLIADDGDNSEVVKAIEAEIGCGKYSSIKGNSAVVKVMARDRNNQLVEKYVATSGYVAPKKKPSKKRQSLKAVSRE